MAQTVVGFFDDASEAQRAIEKLQGTGISRDRVDLARGRSGSAEHTAGSREHDGKRGNAFTEFFNNLFGDSDKEDADRYRNVAENSQCMVTVHAQTRDEAERAADILDDCGAINVDERASGYGRSELSGERDRTINRVEENLEVGKRTVETGGVRVRSRIIEKPVEEHVRLREEHVNIEREAVNRPATEADMRSLQDQDIELTERAEVPVVNKEARVVEEVRISKDVNERDETIRDTVRRTDVDIDDNSSRERGGDTASRRGE